MHQVHHPPIRLPRIAAIIVWLDSQAPVFYICPPLHEMTPLSYYLCDTCFPSTSEGVFPHHTGIIGSLPVGISVLGKQGHPQ